MNRIVFLVDVDNTLLDNDHIQADIQTYLAREYGPICRDRYWAILEDLFTERGYRDYLGRPSALPRRAPARYASLIDVVISDRLPFRQSAVPDALDVLAKFRKWGPTVVLTDGDVVFQPRKVERSGLSEAVDSKVLIYIHKELALDDVVVRYPARHHVLVDTVVTRWPHFCFTAARMRGF